MTPPTFLASKTRRKSHSLRVFDEKLDLRATSQPTRVPSGGQEPKSRDAAICCYNRTISFQIICVDPWGHRNDIPWYLIHSRSSEDCESQSTNTLLASDTEFTRVSNGVWETHVQTGYLCLFESTHSWQTTSRVARDLIVKMSIFSTCFQNLNAAFNWKLNVYNRHLQWGPQVAVGSLA